jgi:hypothetical protein
MVSQAALDFQVANDTVVSRVDESNSPILAEAVEELSALSDRRESVEFDSW